jgi:DNA sulfur modification protein DndC
VTSAAIERCAKEIKGAGDRDWVIGYSGGKDSTATLKIFFSALRKADRKNSNVSLIYCDTGVENPALDQFAKQTLRSLACELPEEFPNTCVRILKAPVEERFFVRVIGRGYAPPSNRFRWCTKALRIRPVEKYLASVGSNAAVVLGLRYGESVQRDRSLRAGEGRDCLWQRQREGIRRDLFMPIIDFALEDVWIAAQGIEYPRSINAFDLEELYRGASAECPIVRSPISPPCASGRFGCWTCTVVRKDRSTENLIQQGHGWLKPYLDFRNWLQEFRSAEGMRWPVRRNGASGPGPFTIFARKKILRKIELLEAYVERELLSAEEIFRIRALWQQDEEMERVLRVG